MPEAARDQSDSFQTSNDTDELRRLEDIIKGKSYVDLPDESRLLMDEAIASAVLENRPQSLTFLLDKGVPVNNALLQNTILKSSTGTFQALLDHGWKINGRCLDGRPILKRVFPYFAPCLAKHVYLAFVRRILI
jgi:hypothetical protein